MYVIRSIFAVDFCGFNTGLIWGLEATSFLFVWLVLFGVSYAVVSPLSTWISQMP